MLEDVLEAYAVVAALLVVILEKVSGRHLNATRDQGLAVLFVGADVIALEPAIAERRHDEQPSARSVAQLENASVLRQLQRQAQRVGYGLSAGEFDGSPRQALQQQAQ